MLFLFIFEYLKSLKKYEMTKQKIIHNLVKLSGCVTQKSFAEKHGLRPERISEWITGKKNISNINLELMAKKEGYKLKIELKIEKL